MLDPRLNDLAVMIERASPEELPGLIGDLEEMRHRAELRFRSGTTRATSSSMPALLDLKQTAVYLNLPQTKVEEMCRRGELPAIKVGHYWRVPVDALDEWIQERLLHRIPAREGE